MSDAKPLPQVENKTLLRVSIERDKLARDAMEQRAVKVDLLLACEEVLLRLREPSDFRYIDVEGLPSIRRLRAAMAQAKAHP